MKHVLHLALFLSFSSFADHRPTPSEWVDVKQYAFTIELNDSTDVIRGTATISLMYKKNMTAFDLDLIGKNAEGKGKDLPPELYKTGLW